MDSKEDFNTRVKNSFPAWPIGALETAVELHAKLTLRDSNWHELKADKDRRAAELLSAALIRILSNSNSSDTEAMLVQATGWLKKEIKDPGCPRH